MATSAAPALFPMFAQLRGRDVLVVGGGAVARRKVAALREAGARVRVAAPVLDPQLASLARDGTIEHLQGTFDPAWVDRAWLVIAATDDARVNREIAAAAHARHRWVNVVDDIGLSGFHMPAVVRRGALQVAISSAGAAPMLARHLRAWLEQQLDGSWGALAELFATRRGRIRARLPDLPQRRRWFDRILRGDVPRLLRQGRDHDAARALDHALASDIAETGMPRSGSVVLVGAGPGDPGLLTLNALRVLNEADVIVHDRLVSDAVLAMARRDAELLDVGKAPGADVDSQAAIHALLLRHARAGRRVVRLKGGDPFVFGRGGEELEFLQAHDIEFEVVPGITAALACAAYAGVPLTHRDHAQSVRFITAQTRACIDTLDYAELARACDSRQTIAVYMGASVLDRLAAGLLANGGRPDLPFALVENGSRREQRVVTGTLESLPELARRHTVVAPALLILGDVAALASRLHWFATPPLTGDAASTVSALAA